MKNKKIIMPIAITIAITITILFTNTNNNLNTCTIITNSKYTTMENDGGSNYNIYYKININKNNVKKYEDHYIGFKGYEYKGKLIYNKNIKKTKSEELKKVIEDLLEKKDINIDNNFSPYRIKCGNKEQTIYNRNSIKILKEQLLSIDKY